MIKGLDEHVMQSKSKQSKRWTKPSKFFSCDSSIQQRVFLHVCPAQSPRYEGRVNWMQSVITFTRKIQLYWVVCRWLKNIRYSRSNWMEKICGINTVVQKLSEIQQIQIRNWRMSLDLFSELDFVSEHIHATARGFIVDCRDAWLQSPWLKSCLLWHSRTPPQMLQTEKTSLSDSKSSCSASTCITPAVIDFVTQSAVSTSSFTLLIRCRVFMCLRILGSLMSQYVISSSINLP